MAEKAKLSKKLQTLLDQFDEAAQGRGYREGEAGTQEEYEAAKEALVNVLANLQKEHQKYRFKLSQLRQRGR